MPVTCTQPVLFKREGRIRKLLQPLLGRNQQVSARRVGASSKSVIFSAFSGSSPISGLHKEWRFKTVSNKIKGNYFEIWVENSNKNWSLSKAYLTLLETSERNESELLSLHCDPTEGKDTEYYFYKSGPHLHIKHPNSVISKAHIALNLSNLDEVINSLAELESALAKGIKMIGDEVVQKH